MADARGDIFPDHQKLGQCDKRKRRWDWGRRMKGGLLGEPNMYS